MRTGTLCLTLVFVALSTFLVGCAPEPATQSAGICSEHLRVCDVSEPTCQQDVFSYVSCLRDSPDLLAPPVEILTRDEYLARFDVPVASSRLQATSNGYQHFLDALNLAGYPGSAQTATRRSQHLHNLASGRISAAYSPARGRITVIREGGASLMNVGAVVDLAHEYTHALQHQEGRLTSLLDGPADSDQRLAMNALIEGEAEMIEQFAGSSLQGVDPLSANWNGRFARFQNQVLRDVRTSPVPYEYAALYFPYPWGAALVVERYLEQGIDGVHALYDAPPEATWQILADRVSPEGSREARERRLALEDVPAPPEGFHVVDGRPLGAWQSMNFLLYRDASLELGIVDEGIAQLVGGAVRGDLFLTVLGPHDALYAVWLAEFEVDSTVARYEELIGQLAAEDVADRMLISSGSTVVAVLSTETINEDLARWASEVLAATSAGR